MIEFYEEKGEGRSVERAGYHAYRSKRWRILRRRKLFEDPLCERCGAIAAEVHHIEGVEVVTWEMEKLESCATNAIVMKPEQSSWHERLPQVWRTPLIAVRWQRAQARLGSSP